MKNFKAHEVESDYVNESNRFVVSFVVGYDQDELLKTPREAAAHALSLIVEGDSDANVWHVFDRKSGNLHRVEQGELSEIIPQPRTRKVYEALGPVDTDEGRHGGMRSYGVYVDRPTAEDVARNKGVMGSPGEVKPRIAIMVQERVAWLVDGQETIIIEQEDPEVRKQRALNKLTREERKLLGL
jgi:hypothetical protein